MGVVMLRGVAIVLVLTAVACGGSDIKDHQFQCGEGLPACPPEFRCGLDGWCYRNPPAATCGDNMQQSGETCDPPSSCPLTCPDDGNACTMAVYAGTPATCNVTCTDMPITACADGDACCPVGCSSVTDDDCSPSCGNGVLDAAETCDPPASCPTDCSDGNACTVDVMTGSAANCNVACGHASIMGCASGDGCCPGGCTNVNDSDCSASCGNGALEDGETCDPPASCPTDCSDGNSCTNDTMTGSDANCNVACGHTGIVTCTNGDNCCPGGCDSTTDNDCSASCGNSLVEAGETCDPPASCPSTCNDGNSCTIDGMTGGAATCNLQCTHTSIVTCANGDGCCPAGCTSLTDNNCSATCGNGLTETGETCDPPASCPASCSDGNACTIDTSTGAAASCNLACSHSPITTCTNGDSCCPPGCNATNDGNCTATCNNGIVEPGETCDPPASCPPTCNDMNACTIDSQTGTAATCNLQCTHTSIVTCANGDGCCPAGCTTLNDNNCSSTCGNGTIDTGETCDPPSTCMFIAMMCYDPDPCTIDTVTGSAATCNVVCNHNPVTACGAPDGCCPIVCGPGDPDCACGPPPACDGGTCLPPPMCMDGGL